MLLDAQEERIVRPVFFDLKTGDDREALDQLRSRGVVRSEVDTLQVQLLELMKIRSVERSMDQGWLNDAVAAHLAGGRAEEYGHWVFYPWSGTLVHILPETEFAELRTSRNRFKITAEEQELLSEKKIGVVGLSAGNAAAVTLAIGRICGEIRLADFDRLELSNMNRVRAGLHQLGQSKVSITAREIAEIDPYIKVRCFWEGVTDENMESFVEGGGRLDVIVDECDSPAIKVGLRKMARAKRIPLVMETSDRGTLDVERYDEVGDYPLFHGKLPEVEIERMLIEDPRALVLKIFDVEKLSERGRSSLFRIGKDITTWPQLAEDVLLGGCTASKAVRAILLGMPVKSNRYYIDVNEVIAAS